MSAPLLPDDANTVCHLWVDGGILKDTKGHSWVEIGSVPRVAKADIGFSTGVQAEGLGPFSSGNRFQTATVADASCFSISNTFTLTVIASIPNLTFSSYLLSHTTGSGGPGLGVGVVTGAWVVDCVTNSMFGSESLGVGTHIVSVGRRNGSTYGQTKGDLDAGTWNAGNGFTMANLNQSVIAVLGGTEMTQWPYFHVFPGIFYELRLTTTDPGGGIMDATHNAVLDANYKTIVDAAQQAGADSITRPSRFFGHFHMH